MAHLNKPRSLGLVLALCLVAVSAPPSSVGSAGATRVPVWSPPTLIDRVAPVHRGIALTGVSCPSPGLCVAVDGRGQILSTFIPAHTDGWILTPLPGDLLTAISCPSAHLCVAGGGQTLFVSRHPSAPASAWQSVRLPGESIRAISCPSEHLCVVLDGDGVLFTSTSPAPRARAWHRGRIESAERDGAPVHRVEGLSCPTVHFCAAVDASSGDVLTSTHPGRPSGDWRRRHVARRIAGRSSTLEAISCPSARLCVTTEDGGVLVSTTPATGGWRLERIADLHDVRAISCHSRRLCVLTTKFSGLEASRDPAAKSATWHRSQHGSASPAAWTVPPMGCA